MNLKSRANFRLFVSSLCHAIRIESNNRTELEYYISIARMFNARIIDQQESVIADFKTVDQAKRFYRAVREL